MTFNRGKQRSKGSATLGLRDTRGFTLVEILIAMGISSILALAIASLLMNQGKSMRNVENLSDLNELQNDIEQALGSANSCLQMIAQSSTTPVATTLSGINQLYAPVALAKNQQYGHLTILSISVPTLPTALLPVPIVQIGSAPPYLYSAYLDVAVSMPNALGSTNLASAPHTLQIPIYLTLSAPYASGGTIESCGFQTGMSQQLCSGILGPGGALATFVAGPPSTCSIPPGTGIPGTIPMWSATTPPPQSLTSSPLTVTTGIVTVTDSLNVTGNVAVTGNETVTGTVTATGVAGPSDIRLKKDIHELKDSLDKILQLRGVSYYWKDPARSSGRQVGVIAQEVEKQFPELVLTDPKGMKSVEYQNLVAPLIEAVKAQQKEIVELQSRLQDLESGHKPVSRTLSGVRTQKLPSEVSK